DMDGAPAPNMDADEFASLVYVAAVTQQYFCEDYGPEGGGIHDDLPNWLGMDLNVDGKVSLYELVLCSPIPWATAEGVQELAIFIPTIPSSSGPDSSATKAYISVILGINSPPAG
ncbi:unnamed protein product, partial [marine sediment metagenome]